MPKLDCRTKKDRDKKECIKKREDKLKKSNKQKKQEKFDLYSTDPYEVYGLKQDEKFTLSKINKIRMKLNAATVPRMVTRKDGTMEKKGNSQHFRKVQRAYDILKNVLIRTNCRNKEAPTRKSTRKSTRKPCPTPTRKPCPTPTRKPCPTPTRKRCNINSPTRKPCPTPIRKPCPTPIRKPCIETSFGKYDLDSSDPYKLFGLKNKKYTLEDLKNRWHLLARLTHPDKTIIDRNGQLVKIGNPDKFANVRKAYIFLKNKKENKK